MKIIITLFTVFIVNAALSQTVVGSTKFEGRQVKVYPYRVSYERTLSTDRNFLLINENIDIPFCPLVLPDGEYIAFYAKTHHLDRDYNIYYRKGDTDNLAIHFFIKDGKKEGEALWYTNYIRHKSIYQRGSYINDLKEGRWEYISNKKISSYNYKNGLLEGEVKLFNWYGNFETTFYILNGELNGKYTSINFKTKERTEFEYLDGKKTGPYHSIRHNLRITDLELPGWNRRPGNYAMYAEKYATIEIKGNHSQSRSTLCVVVFITTPSR